MSNVLYKFVAGFFMGIAEITPGISGATIAGLFNVYKDFLSSLTAFSQNPKDITFKRFMKNLNINFRDNFVWTKVRDRHLQADVNLLKEKISSTF